MGEKQEGDTINVNICAYAYMSMIDMAIRIRNSKINSGKVVEILVLHNASNSLVNHIRTLVEDACEYFSTNIINDTNVVLFQTKFLVKTKILFNLPVLYAICKKANLL
jgi:hypothetical protein